MRHLRAAIEVARQTMLLLLQNRLLWGVLALHVVAALLLLIIGPKLLDREPARDFYVAVEWWMFAKIILPLTAIYFGVQAMHGDIEDRTFQYLFLRPVPRAVVLFGKWLAVASICALLFALGAVLLFLALAARPALWADGVDPRLAIVFAQGLALSAFAYAAVAALLSAWSNWPLVWGAAYVFFLEMLVADFLPARAGIRVLTITDPMRRFLLDGIEPSRRVADMLWPAERAFEASQIGAPLVNLALLSAITLLQSLWLYTRREYDSRQRE